MASTSCLGRWLTFFQKHFNTAGEWSKWAAGAAYTVYIIHPMVVVPITWTWVLILRALGEEVYFNTAASDTTSTTQLSSDGFIWAGWFYVSIVSLAILWPLSAAVRRLPGLREVL